MREFDREDAVIVRQMKKDLLKVLRNKDIAIGLTAMASLIIDHFPEDLVKQIFSKCYEAKNSVKKEKQEKTYEVNETKPFRDT